MEISSRRNPDLHSQQLRPEAYDCIDLRVVMRLSSLAINQPQRILPCKLVVQ